MGYFEKSQIVKEEILSLPTLLDTARDAFDERIEEFTSGGTVNLYRVGKLPSGLHVALRAFRTDVQEGRNPLGYQMELMEYYCQNAEYLSGHSYSDWEPVPEFCVGVVYGEKAGIFTQDLSAGGTEKIETHAGNDYVLVGAEKRKVFVDIDNFFRDMLDLELKYFSGDNFIGL